VTVCPVLSDSMPLIWWRFVLVATCPRGNLMYVYMVAACKDPCRRVQLGGGVPVELLCRYIYYIRPQCTASGCADSCTAGHSVQLVAVQVHLLQATEYS
jgi:hypothetical protein